MTETLKRATFTVQYWDVEDKPAGVDIVRALPFIGSDGQNWSDLMKLQEMLIFFAVNKTAAIGSFLQFPDAMSIVEKMAKMLWVVGKKERGIDLDNLLKAGDFAQLGRIFLSEGYDETGVVPRPFTPSAIARIHGFDFEGKLEEHSKAWRKKMAAEAAAELMAETNPTPTPEPTAAESLRLGSPAMEATQAADPIAVKVEEKQPKPTINTPPPVPAMLVST